MGEVTDTVSSGTVKSFDFERMLIAFESITFTKDDDVRALPDTVPFLNAMDEVTLLFDHLGTGFGFVRADVEHKSHILREYYRQNPEESEFLDDIVQKEISQKSIRTNKPPSAGRTLLRLMWATKFLYVLMMELNDSFSPNSKKTLKNCVSKAYDEALKEHHGWPIRTAVSVAVNLLPSKEDFLKSLHVQLDKREEYLGRVKNSFGPLVEKMYAYYDHYKILDLP
mmetsp:Transcript_4724/g.8240  ORF Transcript_4724/g.8240 Transcript_4724/m.8240 type:complete len:225 (-) Transcript_4724:2466-3140(-)